MTDADRAWEALPIKERVRFVFGIGPAEMFPRAERANGDDQSRQARPTADDRIVAERPGPGRA